MAASRVKVTYRPANYATDLPKGSRFAAMDSFLLSDQVQDVSIAAAKDIASDAVDIIVAEAYETGTLADSVDVAPGRVITVNTYPRTTAVVTMHGGVPPRATDPEASTGAIAEFGNSQREAVRPLGRAGRKYDTPRRLA
jgi:hypothetical protein